MVSLSKSLNMAPKFAIFYEDGSIIEGGNDLIEITFKISKAWLEAPNDGVQAIVVEREDVCRGVWRDKDYYLMLSGGTIYAPEDLGPYLRKHLKGMVKFGLCLNDEEYKSVMQKVKKYTKISRVCDRKPKPDEGLEWPDEKEVD